MFWIVLLLILGGVAMLAVMWCVWHLSEGVKLLHDRVDTLEEHPPEDPFDDLK